MDFILSSLPESLKESLDAIFHAPFRPGGKFAYQAGQVFPVATICDAYPRQEELTQVVLDALDHGLYEKLILCSGDIKTGMLPISAMQLIRLLEAKGPTILPRVIFDPVSVHTGTDMTLSWQHGSPLIEPDEKNRKLILIFCRPWHARRVLQTSLEQTPYFKPVFKLGTYDGCSMDNWHQSTEYMAWMWSELKRLGKPTTGVIQPIFGWSNEELEPVHDQLEAYLRGKQIDPAQIARAEPGANGQIAHEPSNPLLDYPLSVEQDFKRMEKITDMLGSYVGQMTSSSAQSTNLQSYRELLDRLLQAVVRGDQAPSAHGPRLVCG